MAALGHGGAVPGFVLHGLLPAMVYREGDARELDRPAIASFRGPDHSGPGDPANFLAGDEPVASAGARQAHRATGGAYRPLRAVRRDGADAADRLYRHGREHGVFSQFRDPEIRGYSGVRLPGGRRPGDELQGIRKARGLHP